MATDGVTYVGGIRHARALGLQIAISVILVLAACGDNGQPGTDARGAVQLKGILLYAISECHENAEGAVLKQTLYARQGESNPVALWEFSWSGPVLLHQLCNLFGLMRSGGSEIFAFPLQRLGLSPDGTQIIFELADDSSLVAPNRLLAAEEEGIFTVRPDGTGLRRLGPHSRDPATRIIPDPGGPTGLLGSSRGFFGFSPDGKRITFTDLGPGPEGEDAPQVFVLDLDSGERLQVTCLDPLEPRFPPTAAVQAGSFISDDQIQFATVAVSDWHWNIVPTDGTCELKQFGTSEVPPPGGGQIREEFLISGGGQFFTGHRPGTPERIYYGGWPNIHEFFWRDDANDLQLQLTNFHRSDTGHLSGWLFDAFAQRILFTASADPFETNPHENCQIFSMDRFGGDLRQLTNFGEGELSANGCDWRWPPGCGVGLRGQGVAFGVIVFDSSCDPFTTGVYGSEIFAMRSDGTGIRQLTETRGMKIQADGTVTVEIVGPYIYSTVS